jgi:hypothetical protein
MMIILIILDPYVLFMYKLLNWCRVKLNISVMFALKAAELAQCAG